MRELRPEEAPAGAHRQHFEGRRDGGHPEQVPEGRVAGGELRRQPGRDVGEAEVVAEPDGNAQRVEVVLDVGERDPEVGVVVQDEFAPAGAGTHRHVGTSLESSVDGAAVDDQPQPPVLLGHEEDRYPAQRPGAPAQQAGGVHVADELVVVGLREAELRVHVALDVAFGFADGAPLLGAEED